MFRGLFSPDNPVMRFFTWVGYIWFLNILWLVCSLPIFTIGASTTALIYSCMKLRADEGYVWKNFFKSFKENFRQSTLIWLIYLPLGLLIGLGMIFWNNYNIPGSKLIWCVVFAMGILYSISLLYVFAVQSKFVNTIKNTIFYSFLLAFTNIKETILLALIVVGVVLINLVSPFVVNFVTINIGIGIVVYLMGFHYQKIFEKYIPKKEYADYDVEDTSEEMQEEAEDVAENEELNETEESPIKKDRQSEEN